MIITIQEAINVIRCEMCISHEEMTDDFYEALNIVIDALEAQEKAQEVSNNSPEVGKENGELINRQMSIGAMRKIDGMATLSDGDTVIRKSAVEYVLLHLPSAQPQRKRGKWIYGEDNPGTGRDGWFCSKCGHFELWDYSADMKSAELNLPNYCPNCGADMRGEQDDVISRQMDIHRYDTCKHEKEP